MGNGEAVSQSCVTQDHGACAHVALLENAKRKQIAASDAAEGDMVACAENIHARFDIQHWTDT